MSTAPRPWWSRPSEGARHRRGAGLRPAQPPRHGAGVDRRQPARAPRASRVSRQPSSKSSRLPSSTARSPAARPSQAADIALERRGAATPCPRTCRRRLRHGRPRGAARRCGAGSTVLRAADLARPEIVARRRAGHDRLRGSRHGAELARQRAGERRRARRHHRGRQPQSKRTLQASWSRPARCRSAPPFPARSPPPAKPGCRQLTVRATTKEYPDAIRILLSPLASISLLAACAALPRAPAAPPTGSPTSARPRAFGDRGSDRPARLQAGADADARRRSRRSTIRTRCGASGSRAFFKDQRAAPVGDIMTVRVRVTDSAKHRQRDAALAARTARARRRQTCSARDRVRQGPADDVTAGDAR